MPVLRSAPAYPANAPIAGLRTPEMFVICAARLWVAGFRDGQRAARDLRQGLAAAGVPDEGLAGICGFFETVASTAHRGLDIRCVRCPHLGGDEAMLLQAVSLLQHGLQDGAAALLDDWMPPTARRVAVTPLGWFADALADAGLVILRRHAEAGRVAPAATIACTDHGLSLVQ